MLENLPIDLFIRVCHYLTVYEINQLCSTNHNLSHLQHDKRLWQEALSLVSKGTMTQLWKLWGVGRENMNEVDGFQWKELARQAFEINRLNKIRWIPLHYHETSHRPVDKMEAHGMCLLEDRYIAVVGGWSRVEGNRIYFVDGSAIPHSIISIETTTINNPRFRYGFSTIAHKNKLVIFGGCREGGYAYECDDLYVVECTFHKAETDGSIESDGYAISNPENEELFRKAIIGEWKSVTATYSDNLTPLQAPENGILPTKRGYHGCCTFSLNERDHMLIWGGLYENDLTGKLEYLDLDNLLWSSAITEGTEPCARFGLSIIPVSVAKSSATSLPIDVPCNEVNKFIFTGGSNGTDLIRNGEELYDIHVLTLIRPSADQPFVKFVWSSLKYGVDESLLPGRCHSVVSLGDKIIYFGGSAANSSNVSVFSVPPTDELNVLLDVESEEDCDIAYLTAPELVMNWNRETTVARKSIIPCNRCSASSVALGRYMIIFGGWSNTRKELGDFWALDLAPGHQFANQKANEKHSNAQLAQSILDTEFDEISYLERLASRNTDSIESIPLDDEEVLHGIMQLMASKGVDFMEAISIYQGNMQGGHEIEGYIAGEDAEEDSSNGMGGGMFGGFLSEENRFLNGEWDEEDEDVDESTSNDEEDKSEDVYSEEDEESDD